MAEKFLMKDGLGPLAIRRIEIALLKVYPTFDAVNFLSDANKGLDDLELKNRVRHIIEVLNKYLPNDFEETAKILNQLPSVWDKKVQKNELEATFKYAAWPIIDYVSVHGLHKPNTSLKVLKNLTCLFSAEFAIRQFIVKHPIITFKVMQDWISDKDEHVRRLVSEGLRPRLPWGLQLKKFIENPRPILPFLEALRLDTSLYVRRSVANNLNDITKDHPLIAIELCESWKSEEKLNQSQKENMNWLIRHAMRSLIKSGNPGVFPLLGYTGKPKVKIEKLKILDEAIKIGGDLTFSFLLTSEKQQSCVVDYVIYFMGSKGEKRKKVFKLKNIELTKNQILILEKKHSFKLISTRKYYTGKHLLAIQVNGKELSKIAFNLNSCLL